MTTRFEWDPEKAISNLRKHGVRFETATQAFTDPNALFEPDRIVDGEQRWQATGTVDGRLLLIVAHVIAEGDGVETIRIISARKTDRAERRRYEEDGSL